MTTQITTEGNLTSDPELRYTPTGKAVARLTVAVNDRRKNEAGEYVDAGTTFYRVDVWDQLAENVAASLSKGDRVLVTGRLTTQEWTDKDNNKRSNLAITGAAVAPSLRFATTTIGKATRQDDEQDQGETEAPF